MERKYCRICWNSANWTKPTREAASLETASYVTRHGVGLEEWLFDMAWPVQGYGGGKEAYSSGFLQPIGKFRKGAFARKTIDVCLYTVDPTRQKLFVGVIRNLYVPDDDECAWAVQEWDRSGRLRKMRQDLKAAHVAGY